MIPEEINKQIEKRLDSAKIYVSSEGLENMRSDIEFGYELATQQIADKEKERLYWQQRCEAAETYLIAMENWFKKELSLEGFDNFSKTYDRWQQLKDQKQKEE